MGFNSSEETNDTINEEENHTKKVKYDKNAVERAIVYAGAKSVEEVLDYLIPNKYQMMRHSFVSQSFIKFSQIQKDEFNAAYCYLCKKNRK